VNSPGRRKIDYRKLVGYLLLTVGGVFGGWLLLLMTQDLATLKWSATNGIIYRAELVYTTSHPFDKNTEFFHTNIEYRYQVDNQSYLGERVYRRDIPYLSRQEGEARLAQFTPGSLRPVAYNPSDPSEAVLVTGVSRTLWLLLAPAVLFFAIGLSLSGLLRKHPRHQTLAGKTPHV
jgi:hypothetical protein